MNRFVKPASALLVLAALAAVIFGLAGNGSTSAQSVSLAPEAATYADRGPHVVGVGDLVIEGEAPLNIKVWYPAAGTAASEEAFRYGYTIKLGDPFGEVPIASFFGQAIPDAPFDPSAAPYPVVILSPGFSLGTTVYAWLAEHLASYGFVVVSPDHQENLDPQTQLWRAAIIRPQDILTVFGYLDEQVQTGGAMEGWFDPQLVAVAGHSYGGYTALAAAGAQIDSRAFTDHCQQAIAEEHPSAWLCDVLLPQITEMAELAGLEALPEGLWPAWADPRVDAVVALAGDAFFFGPDGLAGISVPTLAMGGTLDEDSPFLWGTSPTYENTSGSPKVRIALTDAEHMIFTAPCEKIPWYLKFFSGEFCADQVWDRAYAHALVNHFTTAFLLAELQGDNQAAAALQPDAVDFPEIVYDSSGY